MDRDSQLDHARNCSLAVAMGILNYKDTHQTSTINEARFSGERSVIVVAEPDNTAVAPLKGKLFHLHTLSAAQRIDHVEITVPSIFATGPWSTTAPDQLLTLAPIDFKVQDYFEKRFPQHPGMTTYAEMPIPVVLDTVYSMSGETLKIRGAYTLMAHLLRISKPGEQPTVNSLILF